MLSKTMRRFPTGMRRNPPRPQLVIDGIHRMLEKK
jgi:hypothetical protein